MRKAPKLAIAITGLATIMVVTTSFTYSSTTQAIKAPVQEIAVAQIPNYGLLGAEGAGQYQAEVDAYLAEQGRLEAAANAKAEAEAKAKAAKPAVARTLAVTQNIQDGDTVWDRLSTCEAGNDWARNSGNGYYGGLQMDKSFWSSYGDTNQWARADLAPREAQIAAATLARDSGRGYVPWPVCSRKLGLR